MLDHDHQDRKCDDRQRCWLLDNFSSPFEVAHDKSEENVVSNKIDCKEHTQFFEKKADNSLKETHLFSNGNTGNLNHKKNFSLLNNKDLTDLNEKKDQLISVEELLLPHNEDSSNLNQQFPIMVSNEDLQISHTSETLLAENKVSNNLNHYQQTSLAASESFSNLKHFQEVDFDILNDMMDLNWSPENKENLQELYQELHSYKENLGNEIISPNNVLEDSWSSFETSFEVEKNCFANIDGNRKEVCRVDASNDEKNKNLFHNENNVVYVSNILPESLVPSGILNNLHNNYAKHKFGKVISSCKKKFAKSLHYKRPVYKNILKTTQEKEKFKTTSKEDNSVKAELPFIDGADFKSETSRKERHQV